MDHSLKKHRWKLSAPAALTFFILVMLILTFSLVSSYNTQANRLASKQLIIDFSRSFLNSLAYILPHDVFHRGVFHIFQLFGYSG